MGEIKIDVMPIVTALCSGVLLWALKDLIVNVRKNTAELIEFKTKFEIFKERTDSIPGIKENLNEAHKRISNLENATKQKERNI